MRFVEELVVDEFLPTVRSMLAADLRSRGLTQSQVATALGISQSAVSKYAHGDVSRHEVYADDERVRDLVTRIGDGLASGDLSRAGAVVEIEVLIRQLEARDDLLGRRHEAAVPGLAAYDDDFRVHDPDSPVRVRERTLAAVRRGLRTLENTSGFASLIPNVGSNLVACLPDAETIDDVAGVPGRIFDIKGRASVPGDPEFGVSEHVASVLLAARRNGSRARAALNVAYDPALVARLERDGRTVVEFDAEGDRDDAVARALVDAPDASVLYQSGGFGIEPICYLLGSDVESVVETARSLLDG